MGKGNDTRVRERRAEMDAKASDWEEACDTKRTRTEHSLSNRRALAEPKTQVSPSTTNQLPQRRGEASRRAIGATFEGALLYFLAG